MSSRGEFGLVLLAGLLSLGLSEFYLIHFDPQSLMSPAYGDTEGMRGFMPNAAIRQRTRWFDVVYNTNAHGFRGQDYPEHKDPGVYRIIALGPSFTFGTGVNDDEVYPAVLERMLRARLPGRRFEVLNRSYAGMKMNAYQPFYHEVLRNYSPDLLLAHVILRNLNYSQVAKETGYITHTDPRSVVLARRWLRALRRLPGYGWLCEHSQVWGLLRGRAAYAMDQRSRDAAAERPIPAARLADDRAAVQRLWVGTFRSFVDEVCADGRPGSLRVIVTFDGAERPDYPIISKAYDDLARRSPCISMVSLSFTPDQIYIGEGHWNKAGHAYVAETLFDEIDKRALKPAAPGKRR
ncbi:MAG: hypothetical protein ACHQ2Z_04100 [Elusimicrobiota bacterium]